MARHLGMKVKKKDSCTLQQLLFLRIHAKDIPDCLEYQYCGFLASRCVDELNGRFKYRLAYEKVVDHIATAIVPAPPANV